MQTKSYIKKCPWCEVEYDPRERYLAHKPERCELRRLQEMRDWLLAWTDNMDELGEIISLARQLRK